MDIANTIRIFGNVKLRQEVLLASQFDGRLTDFTLLNGDRVQKGQKIGVIVPPMREALNQAMSEMDEKERQMMADEINDIPLYSPISGIVLEVMQHNGDVLQKGESIVHIADLNQLDIYGDLPIAYLPQLRQQKKLRVAFVDYPHEPLLIAISAYNGRVNSKTQTINIRLALANPKQEFRPGMMVRLSFPDKIHNNSLVIPRSALLEEEGIYSVYVLKGRTVEKRKIKIGIQHSNLVEVLSGLKEGDQIATEKAYSLTDGMEVQIR
jgi:RND family efflux transporter MFP subunit